MEFTEQIAVMLLDIKPDNFKIVLTNTRDLLHTKQGIKQPIAGKEAFKIRGSMHYTIGFGWFPTMKLDQRLTDCGRPRYHDRGCGTGDPADFFRVIFTQEELKVAGGFICPHS